MATQPLSCCLKSLITNSALSLFECFPQISPHDSDFVAVFVNVRAVFAMIGSLALYPAEARHIDFITGLQFFRRLGRSWLWCGILSECLPRGRLEFGSYGCFLNRVATWPHSGTQGDTGGNQGHYLGALNGMGKPSKSMFLMIFYYIVVRMPLAYLLSYLGFGLNGIWVAVLVSHVVASVAAGISGTIAFKKRTSTT